MPIRRRNPDFEAAEIEFSADRIEKPKYYPRSKTDGGNRTIAKGNVRIGIRKQHPNSKDKVRRPDSGSILEASEDSSEIVISARRINKPRKRNNMDLPPLPAVLRYSVRCARRVPDESLSLRRICQ